MDWIDNVSVIKLMNIPLKEGDSFLKKEMYRYVFPGKPKVTTIIELEHYEVNVIVLSFYRDGVGTDKTRYRIRQNYPPIVVLRIFQACLKIFININKDNNYTLVFNAADDQNSYIPYNKRMSAYHSFLEKYYPNYTEECNFYGYMSLNTFYFHHSSNPHHETSKKFFTWYCEKVKDQLNSSHEESK
ncbi:hypothetical protein ABE426_01450 [Sphingobacterium faecium]|uniref:hypothetical protein n=1 Tax=Sphingobacterium faecium TaxID=34087 RepID=UPI00320A67B9